MNRRLLLVLLIALFSTGCTHSRRSAGPPNVVLIFCDDMGYGDVGCFGSKIPTPNLDRMAREGARFTDFYVAQAVCTASRAALMTGCYSNRVSMQGALPPRSNLVLNPNELTMAQMFKSRGYATAIFGKWHLGDAPSALPTRRGFDEYFGLPYSNDMWPRHQDSTFPDLPLIDGERTVARNPDQSMLTTQYTQHAVSFIERHKDRPFFLYVPHSMPHVPLAVSSKFAGKSGHGLYGDVIQEIDWSVGEILASLKRQGLDRNTLVIFTSDNGPWLTYGDHAGSAGPLREGKTTAFEGGVREPCIMRWPGKIPAGSTTAEVAATIDLLPTFAKLIGATLPSDRIIDGKDISPLMLGKPGAASPHDAFYYYWAKRLQAVRSGQWKLIFPHEYNHPAIAGGGGRPGKYARERIELSLFDLKNDVSETTNVIADHPDVVQRLHALAERARDDLGDELTQRPGKNIREAARIDWPATAATQP
jgi:arylsulfatase A-like enzyme